MTYLFWILVALVTYSFVGPLVKQIEAEVPTETDVFITTAVMLIVTLGSILLRGSGPVLQIPIDSIFAALIAGVFLAIGVIAFFHALRRGPVSVVVPIFGLFIVMSSIIGIAFFGESYSVQKVGGILLAVVAIYLTVDSSEAEQRS